MAKKKVHTSGNQQWQVELPMIVDGRILGKVKAFAPRDCKLNHHSLVVELLDIVQGIEELLVEIHDSHSGHLNPHANAELAEGVEAVGNDSGSFSVPR
ncbi:MAG: hypothetical protein R3C03_21590 [Pirellulaceae bacterium]